MKTAKFFSALFLGLGVLLMLLTAAVSFFFLDVEVKIVDLPQGAAACAEDFAAALSRGDFEKAGQLIYGQPSLGAAGEPEDATGALVWDAFKDSLSFAYTGQCYATDSGIFRNADVTALDVSSVTGRLAERAHTLLTARVEAAEDMTQLYDEENNFREDLVDEVLREAVTQALAEDAETVTGHVTVKLVYAQDQWWVVPDTALLDTISGGLARR